MNWKTALTAYGFEYSEKTNTAYYHVHGTGVYWAVFVTAPWGETEFRAEFSIGDQSSPHEMWLCSGKGETADAAFMALLNEKVGPGGVSVFEFIGAERTARVVLNAAFQALRAAKENQGDE